MLMAMTSSECQSVCSAVAIAVTLSTAQLQLQLITLSTAQLITYFKYTAVRTDLPTSSKVASQLLTSSTLTDLPRVHSVT